MLREELLAEIDRPVRYSNVAHLCLLLSYDFSPFCIMDFYPSLHRILNRVSRAALRAIIYGDYSCGMIYAICAKGKGGHQNRMRVIHEKGDLKDRGISLDNDTPADLVRLAQWTEEKGKRKG